MKCIKCKFNNNDKAKYCYKCGNEFSDEDRENAKMTGLLGLIRKLSDLYDKITFNSTKIQILYIIILAGLTFYNLFFNLGYIKVLESENYTFEKSAKGNTYYVKSENESVTLNLDIPTFTNKIDVITYQNDKEIEKNTYDTEEQIIVKKDNSKYYKISYNNKHIAYIFVK